MRTDKIFLIAIIYLITVSCTGKATATVEPDFPYPVIPDTLVSAELRADYLVRHFWDDFDFNNYLDESGRQMLEQGFVNFISVFPVADTLARADGMRELVNLSRSKDQSADAVDEIAESYLYSPESPVYDEEYFIMYLSALLDNCTLDETRKIRPSFMLEEASKNRVGTQTSDFIAVSRDGHESSILELCAKADYTLMIFVDPDCDVCAETVASLAENNRINSLIEEKTLEIVAVYGGDDVSRWDMVKEKYPSNWVAAKAKSGGITDDLYVIGSYPSLYLLDNKGVIVLKNATTDRLMRVLGEGNLSPAAADRISYVY